MPSRRIPFLASLFVAGALALPGASLVPGATLAAGAAPDPGCLEPGSLLAVIRPDYPRYIGRLRPLAGETVDRIEARRIYMALVRPGAADPVSPASAPFLGPGVHNDVLYDAASLGGGRGAAWSLLLLDHEYFHARHLAGATSLPLPGRVAPDVERHFYEAAAWGFNVAEARAGRYPGLRPDDFREALDRYGEHYAALRSLTRDSRPAAWAAYSDLLRRPSLPITTIGSSPSRVPGRPSDWGRSAAIP